MRNWALKTPDPRTRGPTDLTRGIYWPEAGPVKQLARELPGREVHRESYLEMGCEVVSIPGYGVV